MNTIQLTAKSIGPDYILGTALDRIRHLEIEVRKLKQNYGGNEDFIWIYQSQKNIRVAVADIFYIKAESNYSRIFIKGGQQYYTSKTLKAWIAEIPSADFLRCHRSFLVNKNQITEIKRMDNQIIMRNGNIIPISRRHQKKYVNALLESQSSPGKAILPVLRYTVYKPDTTSHFSLK